jgi:2-polyprenyl-3-methyl-5-hydroxy-6-metoxy-1,4-benzoquinol methylase
MDTLTAGASNNLIHRYAVNSFKRARILLRPFGPILRVMFDIAAQTCFALNQLVGWSYLKLWGILGIYWYDHDFDHLLGPSWTKWTERGILANRLIRPGDEVLDVACGDGSFSGNYYSQNAAHVDAFDFDKKAIATARRKHAKPNIDFFLADATKLTLSKKYEVILLFASIEHFSVEDGARLLQRLGDALKPGGVLLGSTPIFKEIGGHNDEHQNEFLSVEQLRNFLAPHFAKVELWSSEWPKRIECYFECKERITRVAAKSCSDPIATPLQ